MADESGDESGELATEQSTVQYPLDVPYCGVCGLPCEYCEFMSEYEKCKEWWKANNKEVFNETVNQAAEQLASMDVAEGAAKKRQTRGGKGMIKVPKKKNVPQKVIISRVTRNKKKYVTVVAGLATFGIDLKKASKAFANRFSCGSSVTGEDEIVIQGDVTDDLWDFIPEKWSDVDEDSIEDLGDQKR